MFILILTVISKCDSQSGRVLDTTLLGKLDESFALLLVMES